MMAIKKHISSFSRSLLLAVIFLFSAQFSWAVSSSDYSSLNGTSGTTLWSAVHTKAKSGYSSLSYAGLWNAYKTSDIYPTNSSHPDYDANKAGMIWDLYGGCAFTVGTDQCGSYTNECDCYNREHSIPKSWFGGSESNNTPGTDIFHVVPTDGKINNTRQNYAFGEVATAKTTHNTNGLVNKLSTAGGGKSITITNTMLGTSSTQSPGSSKQVFEPPTVYKGDFARGYFGTLLKWAGDYQAFTTGDGSVMFSGTYTAAGHWGLTEYGLALLLKWHREDPVSQKEIDRNNGIESTQGNRNPFIDYPILAEYIWGKYAGNEFNTSNAVGSFESAFTPGVSDGDKATGPTITINPSSLTMDATAVNGTTTKTFTITGTNLTGAINISVSGSYYSVSQTTIAAGSANGTNTITVTYHPTTTSGSPHSATITISSSGATSKTVTVTGTCATVCTATWIANSSQFHQNTAASGSAPDMPSDTPDDCSGSGGKKFVGWTANSSVSGSAPDDLFTSSAPTITSNTTFYAVYATATTSGSGSNTVTFTPGTDTGETSVTKDGVTCTLTTMNNSSYYQIYANQSGTFTCSSGNITGISFTCTASGTAKYGPGNASANVGTYSYSGTSGTWSGSASSVTISSTAQVRMSSLSVTVTGGTTTTYSNYSLTCSTVSCTTSPTLNAATVGSGSVTSSSATVNCTGITSLGSTGCTITSYGFVYGTTSNPTLSNTQAQVGTSYTTTGTAFSASLTGLSASTTYYVRSYATNGNGTSYGSQASFTTSAPTTYTVTFKNNGATYATKSGYAGATITGVEDPTACTGYTFVGWSTSQATTETTTSPTIDYTGTIPSTNTTYYAVFSRTEGSGSSSTVTDDITLTTTGVTSGSTTYSNWASTGTSGAGYSGNSAGGNASIQMRSNNSNSGIVTTTSGGTASNITVTWLSNTGNNNRTVNVYGKNTAYTAASDLYSTNTQGTLLGSAVYGTSTSIDVSGSYSYIGLRSNSGALYLTNIAVTWSTSGGSTTYYTTSPNCTPTTYNLTVSATPSGYGTVSQNSITGIPSGSAVTTSNNTFTVNGTTVTATPTTQTAQYTYTFSNWSNLPSTVTADVTNVTANFTRTLRSYTVTFQDNLGNTLKTQTVNYGSGATAPNIPTIDCYTHGTWDKAYNNITGDLTVTVTYTIIPYTVTGVPNSDTYGDVTIDEVP